MGFFFLGSTGVEADRQPIYVSAAGSKDVVCVGQTFFASYDNLHRIDVMFSNVGKGSQVVTFSIKQLGDSLQRDAPFEEQETLARMNVKIPKGHAEYVSFQFPAIRNSKGKHYYFFCEFQSNTLAIWEADSDLYSPGTKMTDHFPDTGDLTFKAIYKVPAMTTFRLLSGRLSERKQGLFSHNAFYILAFVIYFTVLTVFLGQFIFHTRRGNAGR